MHRRTAFYDELLDNDVGLSEQQNVADIDVSSQSVSRPQTDITSNIISSRHSTIWRGTHSHFANLFFCIGTSMLVLFLA